MICKNLTVVSDRLLFAGRDLRELADKYGTPLYLMDEERIREKCRIYRQAMQEAFGEGSLPVYASKACSFRRMYAIMKEEKMGIEVVSPGEIFTAKSAGADLSRAYFNGNNKTDGDIAYAMESGVGYFVVDSEEEIDAIGRIASEKGLRQRVLLRITPGIDTHTYEAIQTGQVDSKFGSAIETGQAMAITKKSLRTQGVELIGFHCHVGSQVVDASVYNATVDVMVAFLADMAARYGYHARQLDLGGGYGVRYVPEDPTIDIAASIKEVAERVHQRVAEHGIPMPVIGFEPGRSIVADAGLTLYTVGAVKKLPGYKTYASVDGGMTDNPRFVLYGSQYTVVPPARMGDSRELTASVVGRCCESGDILQEGVVLPADIHRGELLAFLTTGAYQYSMASNYNRVPRPPVVMLREGDSYVAVRRETVEDVYALDE